MNIILLEDNTPVNNFLNQISEKYPASCRLYLNKMNFKDSAHFFEERPVLMKHFLIVLSPNITPKQTAVAMKYNHLIIQQLKNVEDLQDYIVELNKGEIEYKFVNNKVKKDVDVIKWVASELPISLADAKYLCNRHKRKIGSITDKSVDSFNIQAVINSVNVLQMFDKITKSIIKKYTEKKVQTSLNSIVDGLLGVNKVEKKQIVQTIESYRYAFDYVLEFVIKQLNNYLIIYTLIENGEISFDNYKEYQPMEDIPGYKKISDYQKRKILNIHKIVSYDYIYLMKLSVQQIKAKDTNFYELILLIHEGVH